MRDTRFQQFTAPAGENAAPHTPDSEVYARISDGTDGNDGPDTVSTLAGVQNVSKGDAVIERSDSPGQYDVVPADAWKGLGWKSQQSSASKTTARKR